jgi:Flp pilus assembly pilin Flp
MSKILRRLCEKFRILRVCESGQDTVEYGLLVTLLALVCVSSAQGVAGSVNQLFGQVSQAFDTQTQGQQQQQQSPPQNQHHDHHGHGGGNGGGNHWGWWH